MAFGNMKAPNSTKYTQKGMMGDVGVSEYPLHAVDKSFFFPPVNHHEVFSGGLQRLQLSFTGRIKQWKLNNDCEHQRKWKEDAAIHSSSQEVSFLTAFWNVADQLPSTLEILSSTWRELRLITKEALKHWIVFESLTFDTECEAIVSMS